MRMTLIRDDNVVVIDGRGAIVDLSYLPENIHALQWYGDHGDIERQGMPNEQIESLEVFQAAIDRWQAAVDAISLANEKTLEQLKTEKNAEINAARAAANSHTFEHGGKVFACDSLSRGDIDGINGFVALNGTFPALFPGVWKAVDNSYLPLADIDSWKAFYASMVATGGSNFAHAQALKAQLAAAVTASEVEAIHW